MGYPTELDGIEFGGLYIHEPGGMLSNLLVCVLSLYLFSILRNAETSFEINWRYFILFIGLGTLGGTFTHGLPTYLGPKLFFGLWWLKNSFVPVANYFASRDVLKMSSTLNALLLIKIGIVSIALLLLEDFLPAVIDLALTYIMVIVLSRKKAKTHPPYRLIFQAFILALLSGTLYIVKYDIDRLWFTHKDMVHVFVALSLFLIYKAIRKSQDLRMATV